MLNIGVASGGANGAHADITTTDEEHGPRTTEGYIIVTHRITFNL